MFSTASRNVAEFDFVRNNRKESENYVECPSVHIITVFRHSVAKRFQLDRTRRDVFRQLHCRFCSNAGLWRSAPFQQIKSRLQLVESTLPCFFAKVIIPVSLSFCSTQPVRICILSTLFICYESGRHSSQPVRISSILYWAVYMVLRFSCECRAIHFLSQFFSCSITNYTSVRSCGFPYYYIVILCCTSARLSSLYMNPFRFFGVDNCETGKVAIHLLRVL